MMKEIQSALGERKDFQFEGCGRDRYFSFKEDLVFSLDEHRRNTALLRSIYVPANKRGAGLCREFLHEVGGIFSDLDIDLLAACKPFEAEHWSKEKLDFVRFRLTNNKVDRNRMARMFQDAGWIEQNPDSVMISDLINFYIRNPYWIPRFFRLTNDADLAPYAFDDAHFEEQMKMVKTDYSQIGHGRFFDLRGLWR